MNILNFIGSMFMKILYLVGSIFTNEVYGNIIATVVGTLLVMVSVLFGKQILRYFFPVKFQVGVNVNGITKNSLSVPAAGSFNIPIVATPSASCESLFEGVNTKMRVALFDIEGVLGILEPSVVPGTRGKYVIGEFPLEFGVRQLMAIHVRPQSLLKDYAVPVFVHFGPKCHKFCIKVSSR